MKKLFSIALLILFLTLVFVTENPMAFGYDFVFPGARRSAISGNSYNNPPGHQAYDYRFSNGTKVAATKNGNISASTWTYANNQGGCFGDIRDRGNYIILDHTGGLTTWYFHLSNTGNTPSVGAQFDLGEYMSLADNTGCSSGAHLHFATKLNGTPFDPYEDSTDWVGGEPIPMGYRDQNGAVHGPYALDRTRIRNKWLALEGKPGSPLENDWYYVCGPIRTSGRIQGFEQGYIYYCGSSSAQYAPYDKIHIPDVRADRSTVSGWNSTIVVRNNNTTKTDVTITIYDQEGYVKDSRTYKDLNSQATWTLDVKEVVFDWLIKEDPPDPPYGQPFLGSAVVTANQDVSVIVMQRHVGTDAYAAYTGVNSPSTEDFIPILHKNNFGWNSKLYIRNTGGNSASVNVEFKRSLSGNNCSPPSINIPVNGLKVIDMANPGCNVGTSFVGSAHISSNQQFVDAVASTNGNESLMESSSYSGSVGRIYAPLIQNNNYDWISGSALQNARSTSNDLTASFYRPLDGDKCHEVEPTLSAYKSLMLTEPPGAGNQAPDCREGVNVPDVVAMVLSGYDMWPVSATINQVLPGTYNASDYRAIAFPTHTAIAPFLRNNWNGWVGGIMIQNAGNGTANITVELYDSAGGNPITDFTPDPLDLNETYMYIPSVTIDGSAIVYSDQPIAGVVNHSIPSTNDGTMTYEAVNH